MALAKVYNASKIIAFDIFQNRLDFALEFGATHAFLSQKKPESILHPMDWARQESERIKVEADLVTAGGVDVVIDASGAESCLQAGVALCRPGATCKLASSLPRTQKVKAGRQLFKPV